MSGQISITCHGGNGDRLSARVTRSFNKFCQTSAQLGEKFPISNKDKNFFSQALDSTKPPNHLARSRYCFELARNILTVFAERHFEALSIMMDVLTNSFQNARVEGSSSLEEVMKRKMERVERDVLSAYPEIFEALGASVRQEEIDNEIKLFSESTLKFVNCAFGECLVIAADEYFNEWRKINEARGFIRVIGLGEIIQRSKILHMSDGNVGEVKLVAKFNRNVYTIYQKNLSGVEVEGKHFSLGKQVMLVERLNNHKIYAFPKDIRSFVRDYLRMRLTSAPAMAPPVVGRR
jgi:hypothetical protein